MYTKDLKDYRRYWHKELQVIKVNNSSKWWMNFMWPLKCFIFLVHHLFLLCCCFSPTPDLILEQIKIQFLSF